MHSKLEFIESPVPQNIGTTISSQETLSKHQINICDSCMRSNFSNQVTKF
ncbi:4722_t:CDS:2 [Gigaspora margarita]|uniref:4722_t:CDS:1 n=1 Tax=Gigaspora margarita TaxID=4874 RepID=A0ABM8W0V5_GIGMA|nr:4722_t:CDS:2 [Gigaspora margarita]